MTPLRTRILIALAAGHLALVVCGAAGLTVLPPDTAAGEALRTVRILCGSDSGYGFFAPNVASEARPVFTLTDADGRSWADTLEGGNQEVRLRLGSMCGNSAQERLRPALMASWAATMFARHPAAQRVTVGIELFEVPTMDLYRRGVPARWQPVCEATFLRNQDSPSEGSR